MAGKNDKNDDGLMMAALSQAGNGGNPELQAYLSEYLKDKLADTRAQKEAALNWRRANAEELKLARAEKKAHQATCAHRKQNGDTALAGQLIGNGQAVLVCLKCTREFHTRPETGQEAPPLHLIPTEGVGGPQQAL